MPQEPLTQSLIRKLDLSKNRFKLPKEWLDIVSGAKSLRATVMDNEIVFFLPEAWEEVSNTLVSSARPQDIRSYALASEIKVQKNGKVSIPKKLAKLVQLSENIVLEWRDNSFAVFSADKPIQQSLDLTPRKAGSLSIYQIPIERVEFDERHIKAIGVEPQVDAGEVFPPILVTNTAEGKYRLVWGVKHLLAQSKIGKKSVTAIILQRPPTDEPVWLAIEQLAKVPDLQIVKLVDALRKQGFKSSSIAAMLGKSIRTIQRYLVLAKAPENIKEALAKGDVKLSLAYEAAKKGVDLSLIRGKTFRKAKDVLQAKGIAKAPCNVKERPIKKMIHANKDVNLVVSFRANKDNPEEVISNLKEVIRHLKTVKGVVRHDTARGKRKRSKRAYGA